MLLAAKEINTVSMSLETFSIVVICSPSKASGYADLFKIYLTSAELVYACNESTAIKAAPGKHYCHISLVTYIQVRILRAIINAGLLANGKTVVPSVSCLVIGHWSQDNCLHESHCNTASLQRNFFVYGSEDDLWTRVVNTFSFEGQTVAVFQDSEIQGMLTGFSTIHTQL